jgi:hypothetical protein
MPSVVLFEPNKVRAERLTKLRLKEEALLRLRDRACLESRHPKLIGLSLDTKVWSSTFRGLGRANQIFRYFHVTRWYLSGANDLDLSLRRQKNQIYQPLSNLLILCADHIGQDQVE